MFNTRSYEPEFIDLGDAFYTQDEYQDCLKKLGRIGKVLGGDRAILSSFKKLKNNPKSILDVGCGGGSFTRLLSFTYPEAKIRGIDFSSKAIEYAKSNPQNKLLPNLCFEVPVTLELNETEKSFDIVTSTLVCHHMNDMQLIVFLKKAAKVAKKAIIINDLHRHPIAYYSYYLIAPVFFRNRLITHDGLLSIKKGFIRSDWIHYLTEAGFKSNQYTITWEFPFRWIVTIIL